MARSAGEALLLMTRGLILDDQEPKLKRQRWSNILTSIEAKASESKAITEEGLRTLNELKNYTVAFKHAKRRLAEQIQEFITAHMEVIEDIREAIQLLGSH